MPEEHGTAKAEQF